MATGRSGVSLNDTIKLADPENSVWCKQPVGIFNDANAPTCSEAHEPLKKETRSPARMADRGAPEQTIYAKAVAHSCSSANTQGQNSLILDINTKFGFGYRFLRCRISVRFFG